MSEQGTSGLSRAMIVPDPNALRRPIGRGMETGTSTTVTAEIPAVPAGPGYGVLLPDGSIWYPGSRKRLPAPLPLRVLVWALAFLVLVAAAGDFVIHSHPAWVDPLRRTVPASGGVGKVHTGTNSTAGGGTTGGVTPTSIGAASVTQTSPQPSGLPMYTTAYTLAGTSAYTIQVKATSTTWVQAHTLSGMTDSGNPLYSSTLQPGQTATIAGSGPVDLEVAAAGATVTITENGKTIGTLAAPPSVPWHFFLSPSNG